jgi:hypothetical protein
MGPSRVAFTRHAELRASERGVALQQVADLVLDEHLGRRRNPGPADWIVSAGGITVAYNWPAETDATIAVVVTLWRR